eukprot:7538242-Karenia_brevis.AAC.1
MQHDLCLHLASSRGAVLVENSGSKHTGIGAGNGTDAEAGAAAAGAAPTRAEDSKRPCMCQLALT